MDGILESESTFFEYHQGSNKYLTKIWDPNEWQDLLGSRQRVK